MILIFAFHRTKNSENVSPFNEIFIKKIALTDSIKVVSVRNFSFGRKFIHIERFENYSVIEVSAFFMPGKFSNYILRNFNYFLAKLIYYQLKRHHFLDKVKLVHQIGLFTPIGVYFSRFCHAKFLLQLIGNDKYNFEKWKLKYNDSILLTANSKALSEAISQRLKSKVIYRGVDVNLYPNYHRSTDFSYHNIFFGGGFPDYKERPDIIRYNYKGGLSFIDVCRNLPYYNIAIAGPNIAIGESYAKEKEVKNITFLGYLKHSQLLYEIQKTDIVVIPSFDEGIANVAMEAMIAEKLVISRNVGGMGELITDTENGLLFSTDEELLRLLTDLMAAFKEGNVDHYNKMRENARITVLEQFNSDNMVKEYRKIYGKELSF